VQFTSQYSFDDQFQEDIDKSQIDFEFCRPRENSGQYLVTDTPINILGSKYPSKTKSDPLQESVTLEHPMTGLGSDSEKQNSSKESNSKDSE